MGAESKFYKDATNNQLNLTLNVYGNKKQYLLSYILWFLVWLAKSFENTKYFKHL